MSKYEERKLDKYKHRHLTDLSPEERDERDEAIAERGAYRALATIGLNDPKAIEDIKDIRALLRGYRVIKSSFWSGLLKMLGLLGAAVVLGYMLGRQKATEVLQMFIHS